MEKGTKFVNSASNSPSTKKKQPCNKTLRNKWKNKIMRMFLNSNDEDSDDDSTLVKQHKSSPKYIANDNNFSNVPNANLQATLIC